jgi:hypothetical protein
MSVISSSDSDRRKTDRNLELRVAFLIAISNPHCDRYRLVLVPSSARRIFAERIQDALRLPRISIPRWTRPAEQIQAVIEEKWGFKVVVLDFLEHKPGQDGIVLAELRGQDRTGSLTHAHSWVCLSDIPEDEISGLERSTVGRLLDQGSTSRGVFSRFRWIEEALDWVSSEAALDRARFTEDIKQLNAAASFALVRFGRKDAPPIWFKAVGEEAIREFRITNLLAELLPEYLPTILASCADWHAWWMEDAGQSLDDVRSPDIFVRLVLRLAELQKASVRYIPALLAGGCNDQRVSILRARLPKMLEYIDEAMAWPGLSRASRLGASRIRELGSILDEACLSLESLGIPDTLMHGDLNFGNILAGPRGLVFTDWANASVGNPFLNFEHLRVQLAQEPDLAPCVPRLTDIYRESWRHVLTRSQINCALALVPPITVALHLSGRWDWLTSDELRGNVFLDQRRRSGGERQHRGRAKDWQILAEHSIVGTKIVSPLRYAVRLVDRDQRWLALKDRSHSAMRMNMFLRTPFPALR